MLLCVVGCSCVLVGACIDLAVLAGDGTDGVVGLSADLHRYMHTKLFMHVCACMHACMCVFVCVYLYVCMCTCVCVCVCMCVCAYACTNPRARAHARGHTHTHTDRPWHARAGPCDAAFSPSPICSTNELKPSRVDANAAVVSWVTWVGCDGCHVFAGHHN